MGNQILNELKQEVVCLAMVITSLRGGGMCGLIFCIIFWDGNGSDLVKRKFCLSFKKLVLATDEMSL